MQTITVSLLSLSEQALDGLTYHPEAAIRLAARQEQERRAKARSTDAQPMLKLALGVSPLFPDGTTGEQLVDAAGSRAAIHAAIDQAIDKFEAGIEMPDFDPQFDDAEVRLCDALDLTISRAAA